MSNVYTLSHVAAMVPSLLIMVLSAGFVFYLAVSCFLAWRRS